LTTAPIEERSETNGDQTLQENDPDLAPQPSGTNSESNGDDGADQLAVLPKEIGEPLEEPPSTIPDALPNPEVLANQDGPSDPSSSGGQEAVIPPAITNPDRLTPSTSVVGSARDQVHEDGSLIKPKRKGPLAALRERFDS
jgi:hypothetical protein